MPRIYGNAMSGGPFPATTFPFPTQPVIHRRPTPADRLSDAVDLPKPADRDVRAWAARVGVDCPRSGRVPKRVVNLYLGAQRK